MSELNQQNPQDLPLPSARSTTPDPQNGPQGATPSTPPKSSRPDDKVSHDGTPRGVKISTSNIDHKRRGQYTKLANEEMDPKYACEAVEDWFEKCLPGPDLPQNDLGEVGGFAKVPFDARVESDLYPELVS